MLLAKGHVANLAKQVLRQRSSIQAKFSTVGLVMVTVCGVGEYYRHIRNNINTTYCEEATSNNNQQKTATEDIDEGVYTLFQKCLAEAVGTAMIVGGGCGAVCATKYGGANLSHLGIATTFGISVALAVYATRDISGAHLNPAITASLVVNEPSFDRSLAAPYMLAQISGAAVAAGVNYLGYKKGIEAFHIAQKVKPGATAASSALYNGAFHMIPNKAMVATTPGALAAEIVLTTCLAFVIYALTDSEKSVPPEAAPALVGTTVAALVTPGIPLTGCGMNPARDLGPRLVAATAGGLGRAAFLPGWWLYTAGPIAGGVAGGALYKATFKKQ